MQIKCVTNSEHHLILLFLPGDLHSFSTTDSLILVARIPKFNFCILVAIYLFIYLFINLSTFIHLLVNVNKDLIQNIISKNYEWPTV